MIYNNIKHLSQELEKEGRIMGLDIGTKTIGVAICDISRTLTTPKVTIFRKGNKKDFVKIAQLIKESDVKAIILGLPLNMDESESDMSAFVRRFADNLDEFLVDMKIGFFDERLTSFEAEDILHNKVNAKNNKKKNLVDQIAASVILQSALDFMSLDG